MSDQERRDYLIMISEGKAGTVSDLGIAAATLLLSKSAKDQQSFIDGWKESVENDNRQAREGQ